MAFLECASYNKAIARIRGGKINYKKEEEDEKCPGRFKNDKFLKTLYKISALFQISPEIKKGAAHTTHESGKTVSDRLQRWEEINGNSKICVNILP